MVMGMAMLLTYRSKQRKEGGDCGAAGFRHLVPLLSPSQSALDCPTTAVPHASDRYSAKLPFSSTAVPREKNDPRHAYIPAV